jgi:hypothetical protein
MIYKSSYGDLWCDCGNTQYPTEICPLDSHGDLADVDDLTGNENVYKCLHCGAVTDLQRTPVREKPALVVLRSDHRGQLQVREASRGLFADCQHMIRPRSRFVLAWVSDQSPKSYCTICAVNLLKALLRTETSES